MRRAAALVLLLLAGCGGEAAPAPSPASPVPLAGACAGKDVLVILLDALHAAHLSCYGAERVTSPHIDALAARGVRFAHAWSQTTWTLSSTACLMTGLYQESHGVLRRTQALPDEAETLAEAFAAAGWETAAFTQNPYASGAFGFAQGFGTVHELYGDEHDEHEMAAEVATFFRERADKPRMAYAHFRRPHSPYDPTEPWASKFTDPAYAGPVTGSHEDITGHNTRRRKLEPADLARLRDLYDGGLAAVDDAVGQLLAAVDPARTLVVVLSDHGEGFDQHGRLGHNRTTFEEMVGIAMIFAGPGLPEGRVVEAPVMSIDVFPTLAALCGLQRPALLQGQPLTAPMTGAGAAPHALVFASSRDGFDHSQAAFDGRWKLQRIQEDKAEILFDLQADPKELRDVAGKYPDEVARLRRALDGWQAALRPAYRAAGAAADGNAEDTLRALGYVGDR